MKNKTRINLYTRYVQLEKAKKAVSPTTVVLTFLAFFVIAGSGIATSFLYLNNESLKDEVNSLQNYVTNANNIAKRDLVLSQEAQLTSLIGVAAQIDALNLIEFSLPEFDSKFINLLLANKKVTVNSLNYFTTGINITATGSDISQPNIYVDYLRNLGYFSKVEYNGFTLSADKNTYDFTVTCYFDRDYDYQIEEIIILEKEEEKTPTGETGAIDANTDVASLTYVVTKTNGVAQDYAPTVVNPQVNSLRANIKVADVIVEDLQKMFVDAKANGINLVLGSGYRSYDEQAQIHQEFLAEKGDAANNVSSQAGYSEHQLGLAVDLTDKNNTCWLSTCFKDTSAYTWLEDNAQEYGFIERYPDGKTEITGYIYMPWHYRYVGKDTAKAIKDSGLTLEEYYGMVE